MEARLVLTTIFVWVSLLLVLLYLLLTSATMLYRRSKKIPYDQNETIELTRLRRAHANFNEYVPLSLLLFYVLKAENPNWLVYFFLGMGLVFGRFIHAIGVIHQEKKNRFMPRSIGMTLTLLSLLGISSYLIVLI